MKRIWISVFLLLVLVGACVFCGVEAERHTDVMTGELRDFRKSIESLSTEQLYEKYEGMKEEWETGRTVMCAYLSHEKLESIDETLSLFPALIENDSRVLLMMECDRTERLVCQLLDMEKLTAENIL